MSDRLLDDVVLDDRISLKDPLMGAETFAADCGEIDFSENEKGKMEVMKESDQGASGSETDTLEEVLGVVEEQAEGADCDRRVESPLCAPVGPHSLSDGGEESTYPLQDQLLDSPDDQDPKTSFLSKGMETTPDIEAEGGDVDVDGDGDGVVVSPLEVLSWATAHVPTTIIPEMNVTIPIPMRKNSGNQFSVGSFHKYSIFESTRTSQLESLTKEPNGWLVPDKLEISLKKMLKKHNTRKGTGPQVLPLRPLNGGAGCGISSEAFMSLESLPIPEAGPQRTLSAARQAESDPLGELLPPTPTKTKLPTVSTFKVLDPSALSVVPVAPPARPAPDKTPSKPPLPSPMTPARTVVTKPQKPLSSVVSSPLVAKTQSIIFNSVSIGVQPRTALPKSSPPVKTNIQMETVPPNPLPAGVPSVNPPSEESPLIIQTAGTTETTTPKRSNLLKRKLTNPENANSNKKAKVEPFDMTLIQPSIRFSNLDVKIHISYSKVVNSLNEQTLNEIRNEQTEHSEYMKTLGTYNKHIYKFQNPKFSTQIEDILQFRRNFIFKYPSKYRFSENLQMKPCVSSPVEKGLKYIKRILAVGKILHFQPISKELEIPSNIEYYHLSEKLSIDKSNGKMIGLEENWVKHCFPPVSADPYVPRIVSDCSNIKFQIVTCSSVLKALACNTPGDFGEQWEMPVVVKMLNGKKVAFVDKPFIKEKLTVRQKHTSFYHIANKYLALNRSPSHPPKEYTGHPQIGQEIVGKNQNLSYHLFEINSSIQILLRKKVDGFVLEHSPLTPNAPRMKYVQLSTKVHSFLPSFCEEISRADVAKWWTDLISYPESEVLVNHVNVFDNKVFDCTKLDYHGIMSYNTGFNPHFVMNLYIDFFTKVSQLPVGQYLCRKERASNVILFGEAVDDKEEVKEKGEGGEEREGGELEENVEVFGLHQKAKNYGMTDEVNVEILPLIERPRLNQIPNTFPPKPTNPLSYCYSYTSTGKCKSPEYCKYAHYTPEELEVARKMSSNMPLKEKKKKKKKKKNNKGGNKQNEKNQNQN